MHNSALTLSLSKSAGPPFSLSLKESAGPPFSLSLKERWPAFLPLPQGEGRGEGGHVTCLTLSTLQQFCPYLRLYPATQKAFRARIILSISHWESRRWITLNYL